MIIVFPSALDTYIILWIYPWTRKQARPLWELMIMMVPQTSSSPLAVSVFPFPQTTPRTFPSPLATSVPPASGSCWPTSVSYSCVFISSSCSLGSTSLNLASSASFWGRSWTWIGSFHVYLGFALRTPSMVCGRSLNFLLSSVTKGQLPASHSSQNMRVLWELF